MRRSRFWITGVAVALVLAGGAVAAQRIAGAGITGARADQADFPTPSVIPGPSPAPGVTPQAYGSGMPAIQPRGATDPQTPAFSEQDVREYFKTHRPLQSASGEPAPVVSKVQFVTAKEAIGIIQNDTLQYPSDKLVAVVTLTGHFLVDSPPDFPRPMGSTVFDIFDAHTGNLIAEAVRVDGRRPAQP